MNGRVYDYNLGRFLSVDPYIQAPGNSQSINPYSYLMNNPLAGTDPTGYIGCAEGDTCTETTETKTHYEPKTGSRIKTKSGTTTTTTTTNQNGDTVNVTSATVMNNGNFQTSSVSYDNGAATKVSASKGNFKTGDMVGVTADLGSQASIAESSAGSNSTNNAGSLSANWCFQGACRTGGEYDLDVRPLSEVDAGLDSLTNIISSVFGGGAGILKGLGIGIAKQSAKESTTVIGRVDDLAILNINEKTLLDRLPWLRNPKLDWKQNSGVLREEMRRGRPIRDASPGDRSGQFLNAERNLLESKGWTFDKKTNFWNPPN